MITRAWFGLVCVSVFAALEFSEAAKRRSAGPPAPAGAVQLHRGSENHLIMPASVNGRAATFLVDTGSAVSFMQSNSVSAFGLQPLNQITETAGRSFPLALAKEIRAGRVSLGSNEVALYDPRQFGGPVPGRGGASASGILGLNLLRRYGAIINCHTQQLFFQTQGAPIQLGEITRGLGFARIPIQEIRPNVLTVACTIDGKPGALVLDTGAFITVLNKAAIDSLDVKEESSRLKARTTGGRRRNLQLASIKDFRIGPIAIAPQRFAVTDLFPGQKPLRTFTGINRIEYYDARIPRRAELLGLLGSELLYQRSAIIDLNSMALYLK